MTIFRKINLAHEYFLILLRFIVIEKILRIDRTEVAKGRFEQNCKKKKKKRIRELQYFNPVFSQSPCTVYSREFKQPNLASHYNIDIVAYDFTPLNTQTHLVIVRYIQRLWFCICDFCHIIFGRGSGNSLPVRRCRKRVFERFLKKGITDFFFSELIL